MPIKNDRLKFKSMNQFQLNIQLMESSWHNKLDIITYLLISSELIVHANIHANNDSCLRGACQNGHLDLVKYLLTSPELKEHANIHANNHYLHLACFYNQYHILEYFIFDYGIKNTQEIEDYLIKNNKQSVINMFNKRELEEKLQLDLNHNIKPDIRIKL